MELEEELRKWWKDEESSWDRRVVRSAAKALPGGAALWDSMPAVDSKVVAETSPIFERHLGIPLDVKFIREGGYESFEDVISDIVPKMREAAKKQKPKAKPSKR